MADRYDEEARKIVERHSIVGIHAPLLNAIATALRAEREATLEEAACVAGENGDGDSARAIRSLKSPAGRTEEDNGS